MEAEAATDRMLAEANLADIAHIARRAGQPLEKAIAASRGSGLPPATSATKAARTNLRARAGDGITPPR